MALPILYAIGSVGITGFGVFVTGFAVLSMINPPINTEFFANIFILAIGYFLCVIVLLVGIGFTTIGIVSFWFSIQWTVAGYLDDEDHLAEEDYLAM